VYIILGGFGRGIAGHAALWIGKNKNVRFTRSIL